MSTFNDACLIHLVSSFFFFFFFSCFGGGGGIVGVVSAEVEEKGGSVPFM